jgi:hypothetical protein
MYFISSEEGGLCIFFVRNPPFYSPEKENVTGGKRT